ncbi:MAG TPA: hypothetical protein VLA74_03350 [Nitrososphaeraceae archaeon]|nr:hypothetical protein [Nitrososphaeraceae archaeon]
MKVWYDTSYLNIYKKIWNDIQQPELHGTIDEEKIDQFGEYYV